MERIHGLDHGNIWKDQFELVGLEMADKVPLHIGRHLRCLGCQFLRPVLAKEALTGVVGLHEALYRMEFGHGHQLHPGRQRRTKFMERFCYHCKARVRP